MASEDLKPRSRRALLTAAAGAAGALAAHAALPLTAAAAVSPMSTDQDNPSALTTSVTQATDGQIAFKARSATAGAATLVGSSGDESEMDLDTSYTGVYGYAFGSGSATIASTGVWGSGDYGVYGTGPDAGVLGFGGSGVIGVGEFDGVVGVGGATGAGVLAFGDTATAVALDVRGKVRFSRSGRVTIGAGKSTSKVTLAGVSAASRVFAVLHSNRSGRYVRAVVPTTGSFTIYLNTTVASSTYVAWFVLN